MKKQLHFLVVIVFLFSAVWANAGEWRISEKRFEKLRTQIKTQFVGHDITIDSVMDQVKSWALYPETRVRPLVIFLVGPTSTGKTALVKAIVQGLGLTKSFFYFDMDRFSKESGHEAISTEMGQVLTERRADVLELGAIDGADIPKNPILMFDEIQKVNTKAGGNYIERPAAQGLWELLGNDGKLIIPNPVKFNLEMELRQIVRHPKLYLELPEGFSENKIEQEAYYKKRVQKILDHYKDVPPQTTLELQHSLIFVAANLDHVFSAARNADPEQLSADQLYAVTSKVTPTDIRNGLAQIFRPEHVSRFGNRFISVPTLSATSFRELIELRLNETQKIARKHFRLRVEFTDRFKQRIFDEGVIPAQGPRPTQATVANFAMDPLATLFSKLKKQGEEVEIEVDVANKDTHSTWTIKSGKSAGEKLRFLIPSDFMNSQQLLPEPKRAHVALRLAATTTVYASIKQEFPTLVRSNSRSSLKFGYIDFPTPLSLTSSLTRSELVGTLAVLLAAYVAEEVVFGEPTMASRDELSKVSAFLHEMVDDSSLGTSLLPNNPITPRSQGYVEADMEALLKDARGRAFSILEKEKMFFRDLTKRLRSKVELNRSQIRSIAKKSWSNSEEFSVLIGKKTLSKCVAAVDSFENDPKEAFLSKTGAPIGFKK